MEVPKLVIEVNPDGLSVSVTGPLNTPILCYGMLEAARDAIQKHNQDQAGKRILEVRGSIAGGMNGR